jgi:hypothetical protein
MTNLSSTWIGRPQPQIMGKKESQFSFYFINYFINYFILNLFYFIF